MENINCFKRWDKINLIMYVKEYNLEESVYIFFLRKK